MTAAALADRVAAGDRRAIARAISIVEDESTEAASLMARLHPRTGRCWIIGITGPPGAGKSTLVDRLARQLRGRGETVGILAVDPTSPFTGGAILGDRVRMQGHASDNGVFIRSMATRGHLGGLARTTTEAAQVLDASGCTSVIIETVGVGQDEVDIVRTADVCVVVLVPGAGDDVQALKAGIMEIADIFAVNKADREGADRVVAAIDATLGLQAADAGAWRPPVVKTEATTGSGVETLIAEIDRYRGEAAARIAERRQQRSLMRLRQLIATALMRNATTVVSNMGMESLAARITARELDPYTAAADVLGRVGHVLTMPTRLDHIGIAVTSLDAAAAFYRDALGLEVSEPHEVPTEQVRVRFVSIGLVTLELLEATAAESAIARAIEKRGPGIHHLTLRVEDVAAAIGQLQARGVRLIDQAPRPGAHGSSVAFIHPSAAGGVLIELKQAATGDES